MSIPLNDTGRPRLDAGTDPEVHLVIPASSRYLRLARLTGGFRGAGRIRSRGGPAAGDTRHGESGHGGQQD